MERYDPSAAARRMATAAQTSIAQAALLRAGAAGVTGMVAVKAAALADLTGLLPAALLLATGLGLLPMQRLRLQREYRLKSMSSRRRSTRRSSRTSSTSSARPRRAASTSSRRLPPSSRAAAQQNGAARGAPRVAGGARQTPPRRTRDRRRRGAGRARRIDNILHDCCSMLVLTTHVPSCNVRCESRERTPDRTYVYPYDNGTSIDIRARPAAPGRVA